MYSNIIEHTVKEDDNLTFIEPTGWPTFYLEDDENNIFKTPNNTVISFPTRKLAELIKFDLYTKLTSENFNFEKDASYFGLHMTHIVQNGAFLTTCDHLPLMILDELLTDLSLRDYLKSDGQNEHHYYIDSFFKKNEINKFSLEKINIQDYLVKPYSVNYQSDKKYEYGEFSRNNIELLRDNDRKEIGKLYEVILDENVEKLDLVDINLLNLVTRGKNSFMNRLFWVQNIITTEELIFNETIIKDQHNYETSIVDDLNNAYEELTNLNIQKKYVSYLHDTTESEERSRKSLPKEFYNMPESAILAMYSGIKGLSSKSQHDYSNVVTNCSKSLEIILKTQIFDKYRDKKGFEFLENKNLYIADKKNSKSKKLIDFIEKPPHFIELGSMEFILKLYGGKTAQKDLVLKDFFSYVENESKYPGILKPKFIEYLSEIRKIRNKKTHKESTKNGFVAVEFFLIVTLCLEILFTETNN